MDSFPHLKFLQKLEGKPRFSGGGKPNDISEQNRNNRQAHAARLSTSASKVRDKWVADFEERNNLGLAPIDSTVQPIPAVRDLKSRTVIVGSVIRLYLRQ